MRGNSNQYFNLVSRLWVKKECHRPRRVGGNGSCEAVGHHVSFPTAGFPDWLWLTKFIMRSILVGANGGMVPVA